MPIIAVSNQKGGCGKTTTAINLAASLSFLGKKTLLVDIDPQAHASLGLNVKINSVPTIYDSLSKLSRNKKDIREIIITLSENLWLIPSNIMLSTLEQELANEIGRELLLMDVLSEIKDKFDYIIIDCPPNLGILTVNAIRASSDLIIPLEASRFSIEGLRHILEIINIINDKLNHMVNWRILITCFDSRLQYSHRLLNKIKAEFSQKLFSTIVHINVKLKEAAGEGKPVLEHDKYSRGSKDYLSLARELLLLAKDTYKEPHVFRKTQVFQDKIKLQEAIKPEEIREFVSRKTLEFARTAFSLYAPDAKYVSVVGDFNNWSRENELKLSRDSSGKWVNNVSLKPGVYHYRFIVDDVWIPDPTNPNGRLNSFGELDSVLEIKRDTEYTFQLNDKGVLDAR